jgi:hypothetical protein
MNHGDRSRGVVVERRRVLGVLTERVRVTPEEFEELKR